MKKIFFLLYLLVTLSLILPSTLFSQTFNVQCTRRPLTSINFLSPSKAWIFGGEISYKSIDDGENWSSVIFQSPNIKNPFFIDSLYGWNIQNNSTINKTTNGGISWSTITISILFYPLNTIYFINRNTGWIGGYDNNHHNIIAKTTNGGLNWSIISNSLIFEPGQIYMLNNLKGYSVPVSYDARGDTVAKTTDGGYNWSYFRAGDANGQSSRKIFFTDSLNGWILGDPNYVSRTTNGGNNWTCYNSNFGNTVNLYFINNTTGWVTTYGKNIWKTTNGGINWVSSLVWQYYNCKFYGIYFKNENTGWATSEDGSVFKSTNGGNNWYSIINPPIGYIYDIYFPNKYTGYTVSNLDDMHFYISKTSNGGNYWLPLNYVSTTRLNSLYFISANKGFITCNSGKILNTTDGGLIWDTQTYGNYSYKSVYFIDSVNGFICGNMGQILKTTNSGVNWTSCLSGTNININSIQFVNYFTGYAVGDSGKILKTTNNGTNWFVNQPLSNHNYIDLIFINDLTGYITGNKYVSKNTNYLLENIILKTTNSGINWVLKYSDNNSNHYFFSICFSNSLTGWIASWTDILKTDNGGDNWSVNFTSPISDKINSIFFIDSETGWAAGGNNLLGGNGAVYTTGNFSVGVNNNYSKVPVYSKLSQNYPNPFNPLTKIKYEISKESNIKIIIYNVLGEEIETLVNGYKKAGTYEVLWDGGKYSSGVYFYKLITNERIDIKKMILIK